MPIKDKDARGGSMRLLRIIGDWVRRQMIDEVPEGDALCEFDCRKPQCHEGEWASCERRLQRAAGELMPEKKAAVETEEESIPVTPPGSGAAELIPATQPVAAAPAAELPPPTQPDKETDFPQP